MDSGSKPIIAVNAFEDVDPQKGIPLFVKDMAREHFTLVREEEILQDRGMYERIVGVMSHPGWRFMTPAVMDQLKNLKVVSTVSAGYEHLDFEYLKKRNIKVGYTPNVLNDCVADIAMTLILASARKLKRGLSESMGKHEVTAFTNTVAEFGQKVTGSTLGIVGMGGIGMEIASRATGFRMKILYHNRNKRSDDNKVDAEYYPSLHAMLPNCDFVVIACPMTQQTKRLFSTKEFQLMKKTAILVNISRGGTVDHIALACAIKSGEIGGAGLDVTDPEPLPRDHPLLQQNNVTISPHVGSRTIQTRKMMFQLGVDNLKACLIDNTPLPSELKL